MLDTKDTLAQNDKFSKFEVAQSIDIKVMNIPVEDKQKEEETKREKTQTFSSERRMFGNVA